MKLNSSIGGVVIIVSLFLSSPGLTQQAKGNGNQGGVNEPIIYYFGLQTDAAPISYKNNVVWKGYCKAFIEVLQKRISEKIEIVPVKSRFTSQGDNGKELDAECGPNTITEGRKHKELKENGRDGTFSEPFASTGAKLLLLDKKKPDFENGSKLKIGVLKGTTTKIFVEGRNPLAVNNLEILEDRTDAITKLKTGKIIDAYYNDELLLKSTLKELQSSSSGEKYSILPTLYTNEEYGIIVYYRSQDKNSRLLNAINSLLKEAQFKTFGNTQLKILNSPEFKDFLEAEAAAKIQELLKQLEKTNPTATHEDKQAFINLAIPQEEKSRILRALQAGGEKALEKFLNNPYVDVTMAIVKEWQKGQQ